MASALLPGMAGAQALEIGVEERIVLIRQAFSELDASAAACLTELDTAEQDRAMEACSAYLSLIDGPVVADYLGHCLLLRDWREAFITEERGDSDDPVQAEQQLQRLVDIEYFCGEAALSRRTEYVQNAFNRLRDSALRDRIPVDGLYREQAPEAALRLQRSQTERELRQQQRRLSGETQRLWRDLEMELLRQRLENQGTGDF